MATFPLMLGLVFHLSSNFFTLQTLVQKMYILDRNGRLAEDYIA